MRLHHTSGVPLPLVAVLHAYRPGSDDSSWTWGDEFVDLFRGPHLATTWGIIQSIREEGQLEPILLGDDGRVWDGHHRIVALMYLGRSDVLVEFATHLRS